MGLALLEGIGFGIAKCFASPDLFEKEYCENFNQAKDNLRKYVFDKAARATCKAFLSDGWIRFIFSIPGLSALAAPILIPIKSYCARKVYFETLREGEKNKNQDSSVANRDNMVNSRVKCHTVRISIIENRM